MSKAAPIVAAPRVVAHPQPSTAGAAANASDRFEKFEPNLASLLTGLTQRAADNLTENELSWMDMFSGSAEYQAGHLAKLAEGVGCLVSSDGEGGVRNGTFQSADSCADLLFTLADMARTVEAMLALRVTVEGVRRHRKCAEAVPATKGEAA